MPVTRAHIEAVRRMLQRHMESGDLARWIALLSDDREFRNSAMSEPVVG